jgi:hypothetical protein
METPCEMLKVSWKILATSEVISLLSQVLIVIILYLFITTFSHTQNRATVFFNSGAYLCLKKQFGVCLFS